MKTFLYVIATSLIVIPAWAGSGHVHTPGPSTQVSTAVASWAEGEVRRVDRAQGRVTLRHGPIDSLGMPPMTMVFRVQDPAWLEGLQPGDHIRFQAERVGGAYTVTRLEKSQQPGR